MLVWQTAPLAHDVEVTGPVTVTVWFSSSAPDTDVTAKLIDVHPPSADYPHGFAMNLTEPYWLAPFENYRTMCPYLVGSYERVGDELARYLSLGYRSFILDIPPVEDELRHTRAAFNHAVAQVAA